MANIKPVLAILSVIGSFILIYYMAYTDKDDEGLKAFANSTIFLVLGHYFSAKQSESKPEDKTNERDVKKTD